MKCCICGNEGKHVVSSAFGPFRDAYCQEHLDMGIEPYQSIVSCMWAIGATSINDVNDSLHDIINKSLAYANKTEEELLSDAAKLDDEFRND
jgi:hypothetical protein